MKTRFNTGDVVLIPATITEAFTKEDKVYYRIKESGSVIDEDICRTEDQAVRHQTAKVLIHVESQELDETKKKIESLVKSAEEANSLMEELASKTVEIKFSTIRI